PTIIAVGVARPSAHGHAIIKMEITIVKAKSPVSPPKYQAEPEIIASTITIGTKYPEIISAILAIDAFEPCASSTNLIICDKAVSFPTLVALYRIVPFLLILAPITLSPAFFSTGIL